MLFGVVVCWSFWTELNLLCVFQIKIQLVDKQVFGWEADFSVNSLCLDQFGLRSCSKHFNLTTILSDIKNKRLYLTDNECLPFKQNRLITRLNRFKQEGYSIHPVCFKEWLPRLVANRVIQGSYNTVIKPRTLRRVLKNTNTQSMQLGSMHFYNLHPQAKRIKRGIQISKLFIMISTKDILIFCFCRYFALYFAIMCCTTTA